MKRFEDKIIVLKFVLGGEILNISAYVRQVGLDDETKKESWKNLHNIIQGITLI